MKIKHLRFSYQKTGGIRQVSLLFFMMFKYVYFFLPPPKRNVQKTQNKYLKNNLLPKSVKNEKYNNLNFGWIFRAEWEVWFNSRRNAPKQS